MNHGNINQLRQMTMDKFGNVGMKIDVDGSENDNHDEDVHISHGPKKKTAGLAKRKLAVIRFRPAAIAR